MEEVQSGAVLPGLYPLNAENKAGSMEVGWIFGVYTLGFPIAQVPQGRLFSLRDLIPELSPSI